MKNENEDDPVMCSDLKHYTDKLCTGKLSAEDEVNVVAVEETDDLLSKRIARREMRAEVPRSMRG